MSCHCLVSNQPWGYPKWALLPSTHLPQLGVNSIRRGSVVSVRRSPTRGTQRFRCSWHWGSISPTPWPHANYWCFGIEGTCNTSACLILPWLIVVLASTSQWVAAPVCVDSWALLGHLPTLGTLRARLRADPNSGPLGTLALWPTELSQMK